jgi:hypothetical protein
MGTLRGGNGDEQPPGGGGLPDLPPEWGPIVIPDDASALDHEAAALRRELRRDRRRSRWQWLLRFSTPRREAPSLGVPLAIMAIAVVATLISLFAVAWPDSYHPGPGNDSVPPKGSRPLTLPDLTLFEPTGSTVKIREFLPAVVILVDGCRCERFINETAAIIDPRVHIVLVTTPDPFASASATPGAGAATPPVAPSGFGGPVVPGPSMQPSRSIPLGVKIHSLIDVAGELRARIPGLPRTANQGAVLLVSLEWAVIRVAQTANAPADLKEDLDRLAGDR